MNRYQENGSQYKNEGCPRLFKIAQVLVAASGDDAKVATNFTAWRHWTQWKDPYPLTLEELQSSYGVRLNQQNQMLFGVFQKDNFLDLIRNFIVF
jgi:type I restriction enzyme R subunit